MANFLRTLATKTNETYRMDPDNLVIREDDPEHPAYEMHEDRRLIDPVMLAAMLEFGVEERTIQIERDGDKAAVDAGRRFVRTARAANKIRREQGKPIFTVKCADTTNPGLACSLENAYRLENNPWLAATEYAARLADLSGDTRLAKLACGIRDDRTAERYAKILKAHKSVKVAVAGGKITLATLDADSGSILDLSHKDQEKAISTYLAAADTAASTGKTLRGKEAKAAAKAAAEGKSVDETKKAAETVKATKRAMTLEDWIEALADATRDGSEIGALVRWLATRDDAHLTLIPETAAIVAKIRDAHQAKVEAAAAAKGKRQGKKATEAEAE
jgi:hypothetical protein